MSFWTSVYLAVAAIAGLFGFSGMGIAVADTARSIFAIFLVLSALAWITHLIGRTSTHQL